jgi:hypothetical protein
MKRPLPWRRDANQGRDGGPIGDSSDPEARLHRLLGIGAPPDEMTPTLIAAEHRDLARIACEIPVALGIFTVVHGDFSDAADPVQQAIAGWSVYRSVGGKSGLVLRSKSTEHVAAFLRRYGN